MLNTDYLKTIHGIISILQIVLGLIAIIIGEIMWDGNGNIFVLVFPNFAPGLIYVLFVMLLTWAFTLGITSIQLFKEDVLENMGKVKLLAYHGVIVLLLLIAAIVESYYAGHKKIYAYDYHLRMILDAILLWILVVTHVVQLIVITSQR